MRPAPGGNGGSRRQRSNLDLRGDMGDRTGTNGAGNGVVSRMGRGVAGIGGKRRAIVPISGSVADGGYQVSHGENVSDHGNNHNDIEEVIHSNNDHRESPAVTGRLEQPVNRR